MKLDGARLVQAPSQVEGALRGSGGMGVGLGREICVSGKKVGVGSIGGVEVGAAVGAACVAGRDVGIDEAGAQPAARMNTRNAQQDTARFMLFLLSRKVDRDKNKIFSPLFLLIIEKERP